MKTWSALALASWREFWREPLVAISAATLFVTYLAVYAGITFAFAVSSDSAAPSDLLHDNMGLLTVVGLLGITLVGTSVPLVAQRGRGLLRLLGTTPTSRVMFLSAQLPPRIVLIVVELAIVIAIAHARGYTSGIHPLRFAITVLIGSALCFSVAILVASRARNAPAVQNNAVAIVLGSVMISGGVFPVTEFPRWMEVATQFLPTTWLAAALEVDLTNQTPFLPLTLLWALMLALGIVTFVVAARRFCWDDRTIASPAFGHAEVTPLPAPLRNPSPFAPGGVHDV